jgi:hypothetical protein
VVVFFKRKSVLGFKLSNLLEADSFLLKIIVVLKGHVSRVEAVVRGTMGLLETGVFLVSIESALKHSAEVNPGEDSVMGDHVVFEVRLKVVKMSETSCIGVA